MGQFCFCQRFIERPVHSITDQTKQIKHTNSHPADYFITRILTSKLGQSILMFVWSRADSHKDTTWKMKEVPKAVSWWQRHDFNKSELSISMKLDQWEVSTSMMLQLAVLHFIVSRVPNNDNLTPTFHLCLIMENNDR